MTTQLIPFQSVVTQPQILVLEWDATMNRLRVEHADTGETLAVYSNGAVYQVMPEAPAGHIVITVGTQMPRIVEDLVRAGVIRVVTKVHDSVFHSTVVTAEVLV